MTANDNRADRRNYILAEALSFAIAGFNQLPTEHRPDSNIADMEQLLRGLADETTLQMYRSLAQRRLDVLLSKPRSDNRN
jgi:hypothetical protein